MKKLFSVILAAIMVFSLAACGSDPKTTTPAASEPAGSTQASAQSTAAPDTKAPEIDYTKLDLHMTTGSSGSVLWTSASASL